MKKWSSKENKTKQNTSTAARLYKLERIFLGRAYKYTKLSILFVECVYCICHIHEKNPLQTIEYSYKSRISSCLCVHVSVHGVRTTVCMVCELKRYVHITYIQYKLNDRIYAKLDLYFFSLSISEVRKKVKNGEVCLVHQLVFAC